MSTFVFPRLPLPEPSNVALVLALYSISIANYWFRTGVWPWLSAPGIGEAVLP